MLKRRTIFLQRFDEPPLRKEHECQYLSGRIYIFFDLPANYVEFPLHPFSLLLALPLFPYS
jgi:hypothetical protein